MADKSQSNQPNQNKQKVIKQCPKCGATLFQGPFPTGEIVNGKMEARHDDYRCMNCNAVMTIDHMVDREVVVI